MSPHFRADPGADLVRRIRGEYLEMPGLRLTTAQAERFFGLNAVTCELVMRTLLASGFLSRTDDGAFALAGTGSR